MKWLFALVAVLAALAGAALWFANRPGSPATQGEVSPAQVEGKVIPAALLAAQFRSLDGRMRSLGQYQGKTIVLNFWATWCAPCREEMPGFERLQKRWGAQGVQFIGIAADEVHRVGGFAKDLKITYPLWTGEDGVTEMSRRLGNSKGVLPHTVIIDPSGKVLGAKVGAYPEAELEKLLQRISPKTPSTAAKS